MTKALPVIDPGLVATSHWVALHPLTFPKSHMLLIVLISLSSHSSLGAAVIILPVLLLPVLLVSSVSVKGSPQTPKREAVLEAVITYSLSSLL